MKKKLFQLSKILVASVIGAIVLASCGGGGASIPTPNDKKGNNILSDNKLTVAMECAYAPYNWTQNTDANGAVPIKDSKQFANGYDVQIAKMIADKLGMKLEIVKSDWDSLVPLVQSGLVDCVIAGQSITSERLKNVNFTSPYYYASIVTLVKKDSKYANATSVADLKGATCTSQLNTIWYNVCLKQIPDANILAGQDSAPAMLVALESGSCDLVVTDLPTAKAALVAYPNLKLLDFSGKPGNFKFSDEDVNIGISLNKNNKELKNKIDPIVKTLTKEKMDQLMDLAIKHQPLNN